jgi:hypothetical protein
MNLKEALTSHWSHRAVTPDFQPQTCEQQCLLFANHPSYGTSLQQHEVLRKPSRGCVLSAQRAGFGRL